MFTYPQNLLRHPFLVFNTEGSDAGGGDGAEPQGSGAEGAPAYTPPASQADLDRIVEARLARERQKYADYEDLKKKAEEHDKYLESQKTEHEKALEAARSEAAGEVRSKFLDRLVSAEVKSAATIAGFTDPGDVLAFLKSEELVKDDEPDADAIKKAVEKLATDKPYLVGATGKPTPRTRPKPAPGERNNDDTTPSGGRGKAAAAIRQLGAARKSS